MLLSREQLPLPRVAEAAGAFGLTPREHQVAELWVRGWEQAEIALELGCGPATVRAHLAKMRRKTGTRNGRELSWTLIHGARPLFRPPEALGREGDRDSGEAPGG